MDRLIRLNYSRSSEREIYRSEVWDMVENGKERRGGLDAHTYNTQMHLLIVNISCTPPSPAVALAL